MAKKINKEELKHATLTDLIAKKQQKERDMKKVYSIPVELKGENETETEVLMDFTRMPEKDFLELLNNTNENANVEEGLEFAKKVIYNSCPLLRQRETQEELGVKYFLDIVTELFEMSEITSLSEEILKVVYKIENKEKAIDEAIKN